jgi:tRNA (guanine37-N1)-methyltransferase
VDSKRISLIPHTLNLNYDYWDYRERIQCSSIWPITNDNTTDDIVTSILPEEEQQEVPSGFSVIGHVAHLNLRSEYLSYKHLLAEILLDKNPAVKTVINKVENVGTEDIFRTFPYELLAGPDNLNVEVKEEDCFFHFDFAKVYWNPRLHGEHKRLVSTFKEGEVVADVMAGVGPFAIPAGRQRIFCWANDLNPNSYASLVDATTRNKVGSYVKPSNEDGKIWIKNATAELYHGDEVKVDIYSKPKSRSKGDKSTLDRTLVQPKFFSHFIMNLPASALSFLPSFISLYSSANIPTGSPLPKVHAYCFSTKSDDNVQEGIEICKTITGHLGFEFVPGDGQKEGEVLITDVRDVAPKKRMFCASFVLPTEVAWRKVEEVQ